MMSTNAFRWTGRGSVAALAAELDRQRQSRHDFVADTTDLQFVPPSGNRPIALAGATAQAREFLIDPHPLSPLAIVQSGERCRVPIPSTFLQSLSNREPTVAVSLLNSLFPAAGSRAFIRCLDGRVRAVLSHRYRCLDHYDVLFSALDAVRAAGGECVYCLMDDRRLHVQFTTRAISAALDTGHNLPPGSAVRAGGRAAPHSSAHYDGEATIGVVHPFVSVSNSEVGLGGLTVSVGVFDWACANGTIFTRTLRQVHLGGRVEAGILSDEARSADARAIALKARDVIRSAFDENRFRALIADSQRYAAMPVMAPSSAVENVIAFAGIADDAAARDAILNHFIRDYRPTVAGLSSATSRYAQDVDDPAAAVALQEVAGAILLSPSRVLTGVEK